MLCLHCGAGTYQDSTSHQNTTCKRCDLGVDFQDEPGHIGQQPQCPLICNTAAQTQTHRHTHTHTQTQTHTHTHRHRHRHTHTHVHTCCGSYLCAACFCSGCDPLTTCESGQYVMAQPTTSTDRKCDGCPQGSFTASTNENSCTEWGTCGQGERWVAGTSGQDRQCLPCNEGWGSI